MKRSILLIAAVTALAGIGAAGVHMWRAHRMTAPIAATVAGAAPATDATPRGPVTIDPRRQQLIGVKTVTVSRGDISPTLRLVGIVRGDETRQVDVNVKVGGWIRDLYVNATGEAVKKDQPLFTLYSPDVLATESEYILALSTRDRLQSSSDASQRAEELVAAARQRLARWDLTDDDVAGLDAQRRASDTVTFRSPGAGYVIEKQALQGMHVTAGESLYKLLDLSSVWVEADVYESDLSAVRVGGVGTITLDAYPGDRFIGRVVYVYPYLDDKTRTNKVRFGLPNPAGKLKPGMYANVELSTHAGSGLLIPADAVLDSGTEQIVFVAQGDGMFDPTPVKIGRHVGDMVEVLSGLHEGQRIATGATFFLDSESQLRAAVGAYEPSSPEAASPPAAASAQMTFRTIPDPAKAGDNELEVTVKDAQGRPVDGADVSVEFFMPAMPAMNMPAMRSEAALQPAGGGLYRGIGRMPMAGRWDATVTATRSGQRLGTKQASVVAR